MNHLILASASPYKQDLLSRLNLNFKVQSPNIEEVAPEEEMPATTAKRLSLMKARLVAKSNPGSVVIGTDQVAELNGLPINKPGTHQSAVEQLTQQSGQTVLFHTGLAVVRYNPIGEAECFGSINTTRVRFRHLEYTDIESYLRSETPYDCAGSFKAEGLGISLFEQIDSSDPTSLIGLPLIELCSIFRKIGINL